MGAAFKVGPLRSLMSPVGTNDDIRCSVNVMELLLLLGELIFLLSLCCELNVYQPNLIHPTTFHSWLTPIGVTSMTGWIEAVT